MLEGIEDIVRQAREQINHKPAFQVVHADYFGVGHHLSGGADERCVKVEDNVNEEDDVDDAVDDEQRHVVHRFALEGDVVWHHDGRVESEHEDDPVPRRLEGRVVQDDVRRRLGSLLPVLRQDVRVQVHHLQQENRIRQKRSQALQEASVLVIPPRPQENCASTSHECATCLFTLTHLTGMCTSNDKFFVCSVTEI